MLTIQDRTINTRNYRKYITKDIKIESDKCRRCHLTNETIGHIIGEGQLCENNTYSVDELIALAEQASADLLPTAPCYDNLNAEILASIDGVAKALYGCIVDASQENSDALSAAGADIQRLVDDFQLIADKLSRDIVHCIAPGTQDALQCFVPAFFALEDSIRDILHAIVKIIDDGEVAILLVTESALACSSPAFGQFADEYGVWGQQISDCIVTA